MKFPFFSTPQERVQLHPSGWSDTVTLSDGDWQFTKLLLVDSLGLFARPDYETSLLVAFREDAHLLSVEAVDWIAEHGFKTKCIIQRETPTEKAERVARGGTDELERMSTQDWAHRTDLAFLDQLGAWDRQQPVMSPIKDWIEGAPMGVAWNYGDFSPHAPNGRMWQTLGSKHNRQHGDYSQGLRLRRRPR